MTSLQTLSASCHEEAHRGQDCLPVIPKAAYQLTRWRENENIGLKKL